MKFVYIAYRRLYGITYINDIFMHFTYKLFDNIYNDEIYDFIF